MTCSECDRYRIQGCSTCDECGERLPDDCPYCSEYRESGFSYCRRCGRRLVEEKSRLKPMDVVAIISSMLVISMLLIEVVSVILGQDEVFQCISNGTPLKVNLIVPVLVKVGELTGLALDIYWVFILIMFLGSVFLVFWHSRKAMSSSEKKGIARARDTPLYWIGLTFGSSLVIQAVMLLVIFGSGSGITIPNLPTDLGQSIMLYTNAGVWEEIICRVLFIGIPMVIIASIKHYRSPLKYLLGGFGVNKITIILILISSMFFAIGHLSGWGWNKIPLVLVGGLAMGWLYARFGLHACIVFHCLTDLMSVGMSSFPITQTIFILIFLIGFAGTPLLIWHIIKNVGAVKDMPLIEETQDSIFRRRD